jgi:hypothetical protein
MTAARISLVAAACLLGGGVARAQPAPAPAPAKPSGDKVDAKALMQSGVRLLEAKDYLGALAVFKDAYARFASAKILLNIGTTLRLLDRKHEAANAYQRYLESPDADPAKKTEVAAAIAQLDKGVGRLEISVTPADAEVQVNDDDWVPAEKLKLHRVAQGQFTVKARKDKFQTEARSAQITGGEKAGIAIVLTALPEDKVFVPVPATTPIPTDRDAGVRAELPDDAPRSRLGGFAMLHIDPPRKGGAALLGATVDALPNLQVQAAAIVGPYYGGFGGASYAFLSGTYRPFAAAGLLVFGSAGARFALRVGGGLEIALTRHVALLAELGVEYVINNESDINKAVLIPAIGASARL